MELSCIAFTVEEKASEGEESEREKEIEREREESVFTLREV